MSKKKIQLTEKDLRNIVKRVIKEEDLDESREELLGAVDDYLNKIQEVIRDYDRESVLKLRDQLDDIYRNLR